MVENEQIILDIKPLSKWKRILVFLGDYFISFILAFVLFNLAVFPVGKIICGTQNQSERAAQMQNQALLLLRDDGYIYQPSEGASFEDSVNYSFKVFLSYYAFDETNPDPENPQFGHKLENEVIRHYYENVIQNTQQYVSDFVEINIDGMFEIADTVDSIALKSEYKALLANELLEVSDESEYSLLMTNFRDHVFARLFYLKVYDHILVNDYVKSGISYNDLLEQAREIMKSLQWVVSISALVSTVFSWGIVYVLYPVFNKEKRTFTMSAMHLSKLHYKSLNFIDNKNVMIQSFYHFVFMLSYLVFLPILFFGISFSFNLPLLLILGIISLGLILISMLFIFINEYNRSGHDILTNVVFVPTCEIDNLYVSEQYGK